MRIVGGLLLLVVGFGGAAYYTLPSGDLAPAGDLAQGAAERGSTQPPIGRLSGSFRNSGEGGRVDVPRPELAVRAPEQRGATFRPAAGPSTALPLPNDESRRPFISAPLTEAARWELTRDLQRELRRVGCYAGEIDGSWGSGSKRAIGTFMHRVNANLPSDQPDYVVLALVKAQTERVCGACGSGESLEEDGRCLPNVIVARNIRRSEKARLAASEKGPSEPESKRLVEGAAPRPTAKSWTATVRPEPSAVAAAAQAPSALPGRMSVGAPVANERFEAVGPPSRSSSSSAEPADSAASRLPNALSDGQEGSRPPRPVASAGPRYAAPRPAPAPRSQSPRWARSFFSNLELRSR